MENLKSSEGLDPTTGEVGKSDRVWVKPTLERLSLKQALSAPSIGSGDGTTPGS
jgi:hypothetical protein